MGCVIKEEIDIPFDQDDHFMDQQVPYEKELVDRMTTGRHASVDDNKDNVFRPINIKTELPEAIIHLRYNMGDINNEPSEMEPQSVNGELMETENDVDVTADADLQSIIDDLRMNGGEALTENRAVENSPQLNIQVEDKPDMVVEKKKTVKRRAVFKKKEKNSEAGTQKQVENKIAERRELRAGKSKNTTTAEQPKKQKNSRVKARNSPYIRQQCPNCQFSLEDGWRALSECSKCQTLCVYACAKCSKQYDKKSSIKNHVDIVCYPNKVHLCQMCKYVSMRLDHVKRHVLNTHKAEVEQLSTLIKSIDERP